MTVAEREAMRATIAQLERANILLRATNRAMRVSLFWMTMLSAVLLLALATLGVLMA